MKREFKGVWIDKTIWLDNILTIHEKFLLVEIDSLDNENSCFASNDYFAQFMNVKKRRIQEIIESLIKKEYLSRKIIYKPNSKEIAKRLLTVIHHKQYNKPHAVKNTTPTTPPHAENCADSNTIYTSTTIEKKLKSNEYLVETLNMQNKNVDIPAKISEFDRYCVSIKKTHDNDTDMYNHFIAWIRQNQTNRNRDVKKELSYFLKLFNKISNKSYQSSKELEDLLRVHLENGFTGEQMVTAIRNMRSSDDRNWHKKTLFLHATPEFLLKGNNLNKYLNQNY